MEPFSAVVTTGIYCRDGCGGRPNAENVRLFDLAAAAEAAGFRACLRCRPYREPRRITWSGPELVCRAVQLITSGFLDEKTEAQLGARLGISGRHLRRLFIDHLGLTPNELARSSRSHFARRLLDDTDLTITDIAFASGFGSVRQFNRACRDIFRASPGELRARRRVSDRLAADGGLAIRLPFRAPLDWPAMLAYFAARAIPGVEHVKGDVYQRTIVVDGDPGVIEIAPSKAGNYLVLRAHLPHWPGLIHVVERARRMLGLDVDLREPMFYLANDALLGRLLGSRPGIRVPGTWDPFETGVRAIIGQQVSVAGANTLIGRLVARLGAPVAGLGQLGLSHTFPSAEVLASADLDGIGLIRARAAAIRAFALSVASDEVRLDRSVGLDDLVASITHIPGLGSWTAHYIALRLGERDAFPAADLGLQRQLGEKSTAAVTAFSERWRPWRALAATHLWMAERPQAKERHIESGASTPMRSKAEAST